MDGHVSGECVAGCEEGSYNACFRTKFQSKRITPQWHVRLLGLGKLMELRCVVSTSMGGLEVDEQRDPVGA